MMRRGAEQTIPNAKVSQIADFERETDPRTPAVAVNPYCMDVTSGLPPVSADEQRFAAFARIGADWLWETDPDGRFVYFSPGGDETTPDLPGRLGRTRREGAAQDPENLARLATLDERIARRQPFREFLYRAQICDEPAVWCAISGEPMSGEDGAYLGYRGVGRNVDELILTQMAL